MSLEQSQDKTTQRSKGPVIIAAIGVMALAVAGGVVWTQKNAGPDPVNTETAANASDADAISPASGATDAPQDTAAQAPAAQEQAGMVGDIKIGDPVVAKIGDQEVKRSEVFSFIATLPEQVRQQMPLDMMFPLALDQVLNNRIIGEKADAAQLESDPEVSNLVEQAKDNIVRNVYIERELTKAVSQKELLKAYETALEGFEKVEEVHARHILVKDEETAREIIAKLEQGEAFEELAKQSTDGATAVNGGDLGYFSKADMIPEFSDAAFKLAPGAHSKEPVKSQFGFHIIKVEGKRQRPEPQFEELKPQLEAQLRRDKLNAMLEGWQKAAAITKYDINGDPIPAPAAAEPAKKK